MEFLFLFLIKKDDHESSVEKCTDSCCTSVGAGNKLFAALKYGFITLPNDIGKALIVGIIIAGVIGAFVPPNYLAGVLGTGILAMLVMMAMGIPVYVCATASVPIAAALIAKGITPGAALVFLMTGPATNAATIATIWKILGKKTAVIYLITVAVLALLSGILLDYVFEVSGVVATAHKMWMLPSYASIGCSVVLVLIIVNALRKRNHAHSHIHED